MSDHVREDARGDLQLLKRDPFVVGVRDAEASGAVDDGREATLQIVGGIGEAIVAAGRRTLTGDRLMGGHKRANDRMLRVNL